MATHWCLNFDGGAGPLGGQPPEYVLAHGLERRLWLMQYQYRHRCNGHDHDFQENERQLGAITRNWRAVKEIAPGNWCVAYMVPRPDRPGRFYAIAEVIAPRKARVHPDEIERTVEERSHNCLVGTVDYTDAAGAFYEDFTDEWNLPLNNPLCAYCSGHPSALDEVWVYSQRVDVRKWQYYVSAGVEVPGLSEAAPQGYRAAAFPISERFFDQIRSELQQQGGQA